MTPEPLIITVAPNGARRMPADHPALPITAEATARTAAACAEAGAAMIHLHVRDREGRHSLDCAAYRDATAAIRAEVGERIVIQATSEAAGIFQRDAQMAMVRELAPEAVSLAVREIVPDAAAERSAAEFLAWIRTRGIWPQYILYDAVDVERYADLRRRGIVPGERNFLLYVLGRYAKEQRSAPTDLLPFLRAAEDQALDDPWAVCAFGSRESACVLAAAALDGHARVGFENNLWLAAGTLAPDNAALVDQARRGAEPLNRSPASAQDLRELLARLTD